MLGPLVCSYVLLSNVATTTRLWPRGSTLSSHDHPALLAHSAPAPVRAPVPTLAPERAHTAPAPARAPALAPSPAPAAEQSGTNARVTSGLWPAVPPQPPEWQPCFCLGDGAPVTVDAVKTLSQAQLFDDAYIRGPMEPLGPRKLWRRCPSAEPVTTSQCALSLPPTRSVCGNFQVRLRLHPTQSNQTVLTVASVIEFEVYGKDIATGQPCKPSGDYFQIWVSNKGPSGQEGSIRAVHTGNEAVFAVRVPRAGRWTVTGIWVMDGPSSEIILRSSKIGQFFGEGAPHDAFGASKHAFHAQGRRDALGAPSDSTLVRWEDKALPPMILSVVEAPGPLPTLAPCRLDQMYAATIEGIFDMGNNDWQPLACKLNPDTSRIPDKAKILLAGDSTTYRAFQRLKLKVGGCKLATGSDSQAKKYPQGDAGIKVGAGTHFTCARGIDVWFHAFTKADEDQAPGATGGIDNAAAKMRKIDQFDFSYLTTKLDLVILTIGVHFSYFDPDKFSRILDKFLPAIKSAAKSREHWFMSNNRYCGPCFSTGRGRGGGFTKGNRPVYLRELQNEARAEVMTEISMAKAVQHGWRPINQHAITGSIPVSQQYDHVHREPSKAH